jgi:hypothetical protein
MTAHLFSLVRGTMLLESRVLSFDFDETFRLFVETKTETRMIRAKRVALCTGETSGMRFAKKKKSRSIRTAIDATFNEIQHTFTSKLVHRSDFSTD